MPLLYSFLELLFPDTCLGCKNKGSLLCDDCLFAIPRIRTTPFPETYSLFQYHHPLVQKALWHLKYRHKKRLAARFAPLLYEEILSETSEEAEWNPGTTIQWLLIPIPSSQKRRRGRGYNQAEELTKELSHEDTQGLLHHSPALLFKSRETQSQVSVKNPRARRKNVSNSFSINNPAAIAGRWCIVIDDVTTTGATLSEARRVLKEAGARKVLAFTVAS